MTREEALREAFRLAREWHAQRRLYRETVPDLTVERPVSHNDEIA